MMLPVRPIVAPPGDGTPADVPAGNQYEPATAAMIMDGMAESHTDYDRNPLKVDGLDHYLALPGGVERFRIGG